MADSEVVAAVVAPAVLSSLVFPVQLPLMKNNNKNIMVAG